MSETTPPIPATREAALKLALAEAQADENHDLVLALLAEWRAGKPGMLTSEFLLAVLAGVAGIYLAAHDRLELATILWTVAGTVYTAARALAKSSAPKPVASVPAPVAVDLVPISGAMLGKAADLQAGPPTKLAGIVLLFVLFTSGCSSVSQKEYGALVEAARGYRAQVGPTYRSVIEHSDLPAQSKKNRLAVDDDFAVTLDSASVRAGLSTGASAR